MKKLLFLFFFLLFFFSISWATDSLVFRPYSSPSYQRWNATGCGAGYPHLCLDDVTADEDTTCIYLNVTTAGLNYGQIFLDTSQLNSGATIDSVRMKLRAKCGTGGVGTATIKFGRVIVTSGEPPSRAWCSNFDWGDLFVSKNLTTTWTDYNFVMQSKCCTDYEEGYWSDEGGVANFKNVDPGHRYWGWDNTSVKSSPDSFGYTSAGSKVRGDSTLVVFNLFQSDFTGTIDTLLIYHAATLPTGCSLKVAIYSDFVFYSPTRHHPDARRDTTAKYPASNGWSKKKLVTGNVAVDSGSYYWLAFMQKRTVADSIYYTASANDSTRWSYGPWAWSDGFAPLYLMKEQDGTYAGDRRTMQAIGKHSVGVNNYITQLAIIVYGTNLVPTAGGVTGAQVIEINQ
jgi:hypothetical protein